MEDYIVYRSDVKHNPDDRFREYCQYDGEIYDSSTEEQQSNGNARIIALKNTRATLELVQAGLNINLVAEILIRAFPGNYLTTMTTINYRCDYCHDWVDDYGNTCLKHNVHYCNNCANMHRCQGTIYNLGKYPKMCNQLICKECEYEVIDGDKYHTKCKSDIIEKCYICHTLPKRNGQLMSELCPVCQKIICSRDSCAQYCYDCDKYYCNSEGVSHGQGEYCNDCLACN